VRVHEREKREEKRRGKKTHCFLCFSFAFRARLLGAPTIFLAFPLLLLRWETFASLLLNP
jgi:hypothetical protein